MDKNFKYNRDYDILMVLAKATNEKIKNNFEFDDFIVSITKSGNVVGLEIKEMTDYLNESGINPKILDNIKNVELIVIPKKDSIYIGIKIFFINTINKLDNKIIPVTHLIKN